MSDTPQAGVIGSNLKRVTVSYDEELPTPVVTDPLPYTDSSCQELIEAEAALFAKNYIAAADRRWKGQERWMGKENEEMRLVNILHPHAVFEKLIAAGIFCSIEPAVFWVWDTDPKTGLTVPAQRSRSNARFWLHDVVVSDRVGISAWVWKNGERTAQYITYLQYPLGPEWSVMRFDEYDVPTSEKYRGWRTALLRLIYEGVLEESEVIRAFGTVTHNEASELYLEQLAEYRRTRGQT
jgi:hypothetical protein